MLSHLRKVWEWLIHLCSSPEVKLSQSEEQKAIAKAMKLLNLIKSHKYAEALELGSSTIKLLVFERTLEKAFDDIQKAEGPLVSIEPVSVQGLKSKTVVKLQLAFERWELLVVITIDSKDLIGGFRLQPLKDLPSVWKHPNYAKLEFLEEDDIALVANEVEVWATIATRKDGKPVAGVVFLGGSGPTDRDSTMGPNKPLKDLAWGLASNQIAVCRWDKPNAEGFPKLSNEDMTLSKENLPYTSAAINALREKLQSTSTPTEIPIFILGHSLGGMVAPMLVASDPTIKGLILLSASGGKIYDSALRRVQYLSSLEGDSPSATP